MTVRPGRERSRRRTGGLSGRIALRGLRLAPLRVGSVEPFATYQLAIQLPLDSVGSRFSRAHPELRVEVTNRLEIGPDRLLVEARVHGPDPTQWLDEVRRYPQVEQAEVHTETLETALYRLIQRVPAVQRAVQQHRILTRYPLVIQDGWLRFETVAQASQVRELIGTLRRKVGPSQVEAIRRGQASLRSLGLSPTQDAVFRTAIAHGYFRVPRGISVTNLARRLGRSKSTISESLTKIQRRLAESALQMEIVPFPLGP